MTCRGSARNALHRGSSGVGGNGVRIPPNLSDRCRDFVHVHFALPGDRTGPAPGEHVHRLLETRTRIVLFASAPLGGTDLGPQTGQSVAGLVFFVMVALLLLVRSLHAVVTGDLPKLFELIGSKSAVAEAEEEVRATERAMQEGRQQ